MGKVIFRLPSKGIQYGYAEYEYDDDGDAYQIGLKYREFVSDFVRGEADGQKLERDTKVFKPSTESAYETPLTQDQAVKLISDELGASVYDEPVDEETPEWEKPPPAPSDDDWDF